MGRFGYNRLTASICDAGRLLICHIIDLCHLVWSKSRCVFSMHGAKSIRDSGQFR